jgi:hypothetical protein
MRKSRILKFSLFLLLLLFSVNATAEIYRWVDENGRVQFGDRPPPDGETSDEVDIPDQKPATEKTAPVDRKQARDRLLEQYQRERDEKKAAVAKKRQVKKQNKIRCNYARDRLSRYQGGRLYVPQENLQRKYLSDEEREAALARVRAEVKKWCK